MEIMCKCVYVYIYVYIYRYDIHIYIYVWVLEGSGIRGSFKVPLQHHSGSRHRCTLKERSSPLLGAIGTPRAAYPAGQTSGSHLRLTSRRCFRCQ